MPRVKKATHKSSIRPWMVSTGLLLLFILSFFRELWMVGSFWWWILSAVPKVLLKIPYGTYIITDDFKKSAEILNFNFSGFLIVFLAWFLITALQSLLPTSNLREVVFTMFTVFRHARGSPVRLARVIGGRIISPDEKFRRRRKREHIDPLLQEQTPSVPGVVLQDFNSAMAVEEVIQVPDLIRIAWRAVLQMVGIVQRNMPRIAGPGLTFLFPWERAHSFVDLRKQIRSEANVTVETADGLAVKSFVFSIFSVGLQPRPLQMAFHGEVGEEYFQTVWLKEEHGRVLVQKFIDDLEMDDRHEAYHFARAAARMGQIVPFFIPSDPGDRPVFNPRRVFGALYARARNEENELLSWDELPLSFTKDAFLAQVKRFNYDELGNSLHESRISSRVLELKDLVHVAVRNQSVMTYSAVLHRSGQPLKIGESYDAGELYSTPVRAFTAPKVLRDRGIMVIRSAFTTITPLNEDIYAQRVDGWRARLEREISLLSVKHALERNEVFSRARSQARQELATSLNEILKDREYSEEAMAFLIFQTLEEYANSPKTRKQIPNEAITLLRNMHDRILPPDARGFPFLRD